MIYFVVGKKYQLPFLNYKLGIAHLLGWEEGSGLGAQKQGIEEPIRGGEVRDNLDKYKVIFNVCSNEKMHLVV